MDGQDAAKAQASYAPDPMPHMQPDEPLPVARTHEELRENLARLHSVGGCAEVPTDLPDVSGESPETVLEEAARITSSDRQAAYGPPEENHARTAELWTAYLGFPVSARDVCWMNVLQKASRDVFRHGRDNLVDSCGYLRNAERIG